MASTAAVNNCRLTASSSSAAATATTAGAAAGGATGGGRIGSTDRESASGAPSSSLARHNRQQQQQLHSRDIVSGDRRKFHSPAKHVQVNGQPISFDSLGFTATQKTAFHNGCVDGQSVMLLNAEVARSLGLNSDNNNSSGGGSAHNGPHSPRSARRSSTDRYTSAVSVRHTNSNNNSSSGGSEQSDSDGGVPACYDNARVPEEAEQGDYDDADDDGAGSDCSDTYDYIVRDRSGDASRVSHDDDDDDYDDDDAAAAAARDQDETDMLDVEEIVGVEVDDADEADGVNISVADVDSNCLMDPDGFLEAELASGKAEALVDHDLTSLSWLQSNNLLKDIQVRTALKAGAAAAAAGGSGTQAPSSATAPRHHHKQQRHHQRQQQQQEQLLDPGLEAAVAAAASDVERRERFPSQQTDRQKQVSSGRRDQWQERRRSDQSVASGGARRPQWGSTVSVTGAGGGGKAAAAPTANSQRSASFGVPRVKRPPPYMSYNPRVDVTFKPPFSFSCLIFMAIEDSPIKALPVKDIYNWIMASFPFYNNLCVGWKNSVRHNLSLNKCFCKMDAGRCTGKGSYWTVDPMYRSSLLVTLRRSRCITELPLAIDGHRLPWASALQQQQHGSPPAAPRSSPPAAPVSMAVGKRQQLAASAGASVGRGSAALKRRHTEPVSPCVRSNEFNGHTISNPELFPFLARRLQEGAVAAATASSSAQHGRLQASAGGDRFPTELGRRRRPSINDSADDCADAHTSADELGPEPESGAGARFSGPVNKLKTSSVSLAGRDYGADVRLEKHRSERLDLRLVIISRYPSEEHTYAGRTSGDDTLEAHCYQQQQQQHHQQHHHHQHHHQPQQQQSHRQRGGKRRRLLRRCDTGETRRHRQLLQAAAAAAAATGHIDGATSTAAVSAATVAESSRALDAAEASRRLVEEGADLLLNLAGMSRSQSPAPHCQQQQQAAAAAGGVLMAQYSQPVASAGNWNAECISSQPTPV